MARRLDDLCFAKLRVGDVHDSALRRELDIVGKPPLIRNIVALGRCRFAS
jgi:hypothetical protein